MGELKRARDVVHEAARAAKLPWCPKTKHYVACDAFTAMLEDERRSSKECPDCHHGAHGVACWARTVQRGEDRPCLCPGRPSGTEQGEG